MKYMITHNNMNNMLINNDIVEARTCDDNTYDNEDGWRCPECQTENEHFVEGRATYNEKLERWEVVKGGHVFDIRYLLNMFKHVQRMPREGEEE